MRETDLAEEMTAALADAHRAAARARRVTAELEDLRGTGRSARAEIKAEVDHRGLLQEVFFTPAALSLSKEDLRVAFLQTLGAAQADLQAQAAELTQRIDRDPRPLAEQTEMFDVAERMMRGGQ